jgi:hypothetical protein
LRVPIFLQGQNDLLKCEHLGRGHDFPDLGKESR